METSATTLKWFIAIILKHLNIQEKLQEEIDNVIGRDQLVQMSDRAKMPYMSAFITEGQRYVNMFPVVPSHKCTKDSVISEHLMTKGTLTQLFYYSANMDEKYVARPSLRMFLYIRYIDRTGI